MLTREIDVVPDDEEIIDIPHRPNDAKLIIQAFPDFPACFLIIRITFCHALLAEHVKVGPGIVAFRDIIVREFGFAEFNRDIAAVGNLLGVLDGFRCIRENRAHLVLALYVELSAGIPHAVLIGELLPCLDAEQNIVRLCIFRVGIVAVIGRDQRNAELLRDRKERSVDLLLVRITMVLQLEEEIALAEAVIVLKSGFLSRVDVAAHDITGYFAGKTGGAGNDALVILTQKFHVNARAIVIPLQEGMTHNLGEVLISFIILREENEMIIAVVAGSRLAVKTRAGGYVDFAAKHGLDPLGKTLFIEIDDAVHDAVIGDRGRRHAQLFHALYIFFYFIGAVEQRPLRVRMKMTK